MEDPFNQILALLFQFTIHDGLQFLNDLIAAK